VLQIANSIIYSINPAFIIVDVVIIRVSYFKNVVLVPYGHTYLYGHTSSIKK
jgi:hypothetical protein